MITATKLAGRLTVSALALLGAAACPVQTAKAQATGENTVYTTNGMKTGSTAYIDASAVFQANNTLSICKILNNILLGTYPAAGAVIDARGFQNLTIQPAGTISALDCTPNSDNPFTDVTKPSVILLPFTNGKLLINSTWVLPSNTRLIGQGSHSGTVIQAASSFPASPMVQMCASACTGVSIEHLGLDGGSEANAPLVQGIYNAFAQGQSYVNDVSFLNISAIGLRVGSGAAGSGPYTNISYAAGGACTLTSGCQGVSLQAATLGLHGVTVTGSSAVSCAPTFCSQIPNPVPAAIAVQASNNSIEDVHIEGFWDAIQIGNPDGSTAVANIFVSNITGGASSAGPVTNTIHICSPNAPSLPKFGKCAPTGIVKDVVVVAASDDTSGMADNGGGASTAILDDVTGMVLSSMVSGGQKYTVATYVLGESGATTSGGASVFSLFSTSSSTASGTNGSTVISTWGVPAAGGTAISNGATCNTPGSLFSNPSGTQLLTNTLYVCSGTTWQAVF